MREHNRDLIFGEEIRYYICKKNAQQTVIDVIS